MFILLFIQGHFFFLLVRGVCDSINKLFNYVFKLLAVDIFSMLSMESVLIQMFMMVRKHQMSQCYSAVLCVLGKRNQTFGRSD